MSGLLDGKQVLITGVLTEASIAFSVAKLAQEQGANVVLTGFGRGLSITRRIATRLPQPPPVLELDVTDEEHLGSLADRVREHADRLDGVVHAIGFAPQSALGDDFVAVPWDDVAVAVKVSTWSLASLCRAARPLFGASAAVVGLDFDASVAWPAYGWMGVAKAGMESAARYLARQLGADGIRVNLVAAGPLRTMAAKSIPSFDQFEATWSSRAPLGWNVEDASPAARACVALLSDWFPATTGEIIHADGGFHAVGA